MTRPTFAALTQFFHDWPAAALDPASNTGALPIRIVASQFLNAFLLGVGWAMAVIAATNFFASTPLDLSNATMFSVFVVAVAGCTITFVAKRLLETHHHRPGSPEKLMGVSARSAHSAHTRMGETR